MHPSLTSFLSSAEVVVSLFKRKMGLIARREGDSDLSNKIGD